MPPWSSDSSVAGCLTTSMGATTPSSCERSSTRRIAEAGDRSNWKYVWVTEHHFLAEYSHISANEVPHILARTERIRVASGIINVTPPVNHPARIAGGAAMLDHLSGGRFDFGTGRGSSTTEQAGFGIQDPDLTKEMFDEVMPEFRRCGARTRTRSTAASSRCPSATCCPSRS